MLCCCHCSIEHETVEHSLKDLIVWREEEIIGTEMLCKGIDDTMPFYCLARGGEQDTARTFYRLAFERHAPKAYLSFPMTAVAEMDTVLAEIHRFRAQMKQQFVCFDPGDLEEAYLPLQAERAKEAGLDRVEVTASNRTIELDVDEVQQIERDINSQIYARDFLLIDQADMIISFIPAMPDGRAAISSGVERELQHAHEAAKEVHVIWTAQQNPSVFITQTANTVFRNVQDAVAFFAERYPSPSHSAPL